jgi:hypothetical protein
MNCDGKEEIRREREREVMCLRGLLGSKRGYG